MFRSIIFVFLAGWVGWFWMDKGPLGGGMPMAGGGGSDMLMHFQFAFDLLKQGQVAAAYAYIWPAHFVVLSVVGGLLLSLAATGVRRFFARRQWRSRMGFGRRLGSDHRGDSTQDSE